MFGKSPLAITLFATFAWCTGTRLDATMTPSELASQKLIPFITKALARPQLSARLSPECISFMQTFINSRAPTSSSLFQYISKNHSLEDFDNKKGDYMFWQLLVKNALYHIAKTNKSEAQQIIDTSVIPFHPFSEELRGRFTVEAFISHDSLALGSFFECIIAPEFNAKLRALIVPPSSFMSSCSNPSTEFHFLLQKYSQAFSQLSSSKKHACRFLTNVGFYNVLPAAKVLAEDGNYDFYANIQQLAAAVYDTICENLPGHAKGSYNSLIATKEPDLSEQLKWYIKEAFQTIQLVETLPLQVLDLFRAFHKATPVISGLFDYVYRSLSPQKIALGKDTKSFWKTLVVGPFYEYAKDEGSHARVLQIIEKIFVPASPLLLSYFSVIKLEEPVGDEWVDLCVIPEKRPGSPLDISQQVGELLRGECCLFSFFENVSKKAFLERLFQVRALTEAEASLQFVSLMEIYSEEMSWRHPTHKHAYCLLASAGLARFTSAADQYKEEYALFFTDPNQLAAKVYTDMASEPYLESRHALGRMLPEVYEGKFHSYKDYFELIKAYGEKGHEPTRLAQIGEAITETVEAFESARHFSIQKGLHPYHLFFCHTLQEYRIWEVDVKDPFYFWCSLTFSSLYTFFEKYPEQAKEIFTKTNNTLSRSLAKTLSDTTDRSSALINAVKWGHTQTVGLLLSQNLKIDDRGIGRALETAAAAGDNRIVALLFEKCTCITIEHAGRAVEHAAISSHNDTIEFLLTKRPEMSIDNASKALENAAGAGHNDTVRLLLGRLSGIAAEHAGRAVVAAAENFHRGTIEIISEKFAEISPHHAGRALTALLCGGASGGGSLQSHSHSHSHSRSHVGIALFLLQKYPDISADYLGQALKHAAISPENKGLVELLLRYENIKPADLESCLHEAVRRGHRETVELLLGHVKNRNSLNSALLSAKAKGYQQIEDLIQQQINSLQTWECFNQP